jgi:hypothetical protein
MAVVAGVVFFIVRAGLALFSTLALGRPIKKYSPPTPLGAALGSAFTSLTFAWRIVGELSNEGCTREWGDDGNKVIALIAQHYLTPAAKKRVDALLAADTDPLTQHDIANGASTSSG